MQRQRQAQQQAHQNAQHMVMYRQRMQKMQKTTRYRAQSGVSRGNQHDRSFPPSGYTKQLDFNRSHGLHITTMFNPDTGPRKLRGVKGSEFTRLFNLAESLLTKGDYEGAMRMAGSAIKVGSKTYSNCRLIAELYGRIGSSYQQLGLLETAEVGFRRSLEWYHDTKIFAKLIKISISHAAVVANHSTLVKPFDDPDTFGTPHFRIADIPKQVGTSKIDLLQKVIGSNKRKGYDLPQAHDVVQPQAKRPKPSVHTPDILQVPVGLKVASLSYTISRDRSGTESEERARLLAPLQQRPFLALLRSQRQGDR